MSAWEGNLIVLEARFPALAERVKQSGLMDRVCSFRAQDGFPAYGLRQNEQINPVTNPVDPGASVNRQMAEIQDSLRDFSRPVLIVGLYPGAELIHIFNLREQAAGNHCAQPVWVCIDSLLTLCGFLQTYDARALLASDRVTFFWHEEMPHQVGWLRQHPEFSHIFTFFSLAPEETLDRMMTPLVELIQERDAATKQYHQENKQYYRTLSDEQLAGNIAGKAGRRPRLLVPSCSWSTVIQYSVRDTCRAFQQAGWDTRVVDGPAMVTPYHLIQSICEFKPDLFLYIDHLRQEIAKFVPDDLLVVSWVQDPMPAINNPAAAVLWNEKSAGRNRDLIVGYTDQLKPYGYREDRLTPLHMIVDTAVFKPRELTQEQIGKYGCDVCFASNCGLPTDRLVKEKLSGLFAAHGFSETQLIVFHDRLWALYRSGATVTGYAQLVETLQLNLDPQSEAVQLLFWRLNDIIYRHVVIEWLDEYAQAHPDFRLHLYGRDWEQHPRFSKYAKGQVVHGTELSVAFQAARFCLHLNAAEGPHQRIEEILKSGGHPLCRIDPKWIQLIRLSKSDLGSCRSDETALVIHAHQFWSAWGLPAPFETRSSLCDTSSKTIFSGWDDLEKKLSSKVSFPATGKTSVDVSGLVETRVPSAVLKLLQPAKNEMDGALDQLKAQIPDNHSATWRTLCAAVFRQAGDLEAADRFLPDDHADLSSDFLQIIFATECCCAGRTGQALSGFRPFRNNRWVWDPVARLELATGQYRKMLDGLCNSPATSSQQDMLQSVAEFYLGTTDTSLLPLWAPHHDTEPSSLYWRAVMHRENGDYSAAYDALEQIRRVDPNALWLNDCCQIELALMHFTERSVFKPKEPGRITQMIATLLNCLETPSAPVDFQEVYSFLQQGLVLHLLATHSLLAILASAVASACGKRDEAARFLQLWRPRYLASQAMLCENGIHSRFTRRFVQRVCSKTPGYECFFKNYIQNPTYVVSAERSGLYKGKMK